MTLQIGQIIYGFCGGVFGRDVGAYEDKRIEAIGFDWVVLREENGWLHFASGVDTLADLENYTEKPPAEGL